MDRIPTTDSNEANDEFSPTRCSLLNPSESNSSDFFSYANDGKGPDCKNDVNESSEKFSESLVDPGERTTAGKNDVSSISCAQNEVTENDDSSAAEKSPNGEAVKDFEKVTDNVQKKDKVCGNRNGDTSLIKDEILGSDHGNNSVPSIVQIRPDVIELADQSSSTSLLPDVSSLTTPELTSSQTEKCFVKKRFTRSSLTKSNESIISSSSSNADIVPDSKRRNQLPKNAPNSSGSYTCLLCNAVFQEQKLFRKHKIQHRDDNVIEKKAQTRSKTTKLKLFSCEYCKKKLSTSQSLQQHVLIHENVKPFECHVCQKDFRHLSNYRMHLQKKHKTEPRQCDRMQQTDDQEHFDANTMRNALGSSTHFTRKKTSKSFHSTKESSSCQPQSLFDQPPLQTEENTTSSISSAVIIRRKVTSSDLISEEECDAVESFENIESVVMNPSRIIVKLENLDTNILKRKLLTPDISIDQPPKKCRVRLSSISEKCNVKLDEIENIPMNVDPEEIDSPSVEQMKNDQLDDYLNANDHLQTADDFVHPTYDTLSDNELFSLLNDDKDTSSATTIFIDSAGEGKSSCSDQILQLELCKVDVAKADILPHNELSDVTFVETSLSFEMSCYEDETGCDDELDAYDIAFQKVATRRLALLQKRAAENGGKVTSRYLLGPLFWCKALRRIQKCKSVFTDGGRGNTNADDGNHFGDSLNMWADLGQFGGHSKCDDEPNNDPTRLQCLAESKFEYLLKRAKMVENLSALNLTGPLFWRRTLKLAGIHRGEDLRTHMNVALPSLKGVEFVDDESPCNFGPELVNAERPKTPQPTTPDFVFLTSTSTSKSNYLQSNDQLLDDEVLPVISSDVRVDDVVHLSDEMLSTASAGQQTPVSDDEVTKNISNDVLSVETDTALFESLSKPEENQQHSVEPDDSLSSDVYCGDMFFANPDNSAVSSLCSEFLTDFPENYSTNVLNNKHNELTGDARVAVEDNSRPFGQLDTNIVLNIDCGKNLQLMPVNNDQVAIPEAGQNFMLVSDASGTMHYVVNVTNDDYAKFESIGDCGCGDQLAYAIQFDDGSYAAIQFVQDEDSFQLQKDGCMKEALQVDSKAATCLVSNAGAATTAVVSDPNNINKELSDFLNLDYVTLLKTGV